MSSGFRLGLDNGSQWDGKKESAVSAFIVLVPSLWGCLGWLYPVKKGCWSSQGGLFYLTVPFRASSLLLLYPSGLRLVTTKPHGPAYTVITAAGYHTFLGGSPTPTLLETDPTKCATCFLLRPWLGHRGNVEYILTPIVKAVGSGWQQWHSPAVVLTIQFPWVPIHLQSWFSGLNPLIPGATQQPSNKFLCMCASVGQSHFRCNQPRAAIPHKCTYLAPKKQVSVKDYCF